MWGVGNALTIRESESRRNEKDTGKEARV